jgi:serine/threonine-protein kinase RsbW
LTEGTALRSSERTAEGCAVFLHLHFVCELAAIAAALENASDAFRRLELCANDCATNEIVLAEAINNISEHAYQEKLGGPIELILSKNASHIYCDLRDQGIPMPNGRVPSAYVHDLDGPVDNLPEGGFGWNMIHSLVEEVSYLRSNAGNKLNYSIAIS